ACGAERRPRSSLPSFPVCFGEQRQIIRQSELSPCSPKGGQAVMHLGDACLSLPLLHQYPTLQERPPGQVVRKPILATEHRRCFRPLISGALLTAELMEDGRITQGQR